MIKKYIENTEEIRQRLTEMLMEDAKEMCGYQRDIYMYIDDNGRASLEWFINVGGNSWLDDDHIRLHVCREHYEGIEDSIEDTKMLAEIIDMTDAELADHVSEDMEIDREDVDYDDCFRWAFASYADQIHEWYDDCIEDARSDYANQADEILRDHNRYQLDCGNYIGDGDTNDVVWLFEI